MPVTLVLILSFGNEVFDLLNAICGVHCATIHLINYRLDHRQQLPLPPRGTSEEDPYLFNGGLGR